MTPSVSHIAAATRARAAAAATSLIVLLAACTGTPTRPVAAAAPAAVVQTPPPPAARNPVPAAAPTPAPLPRPATNPVAATAVPPLPPAHRVFFASTEPTVPVDALPTIEDISRRLKADPRLDVQLLGYAEDAASSEYCLALASRRTLAVESELIRRGVRPSQVLKTPRGCEAVEPCSSEACRQQWRRVDLRLTD